METLVEITDLEVAYGRTVALRGIDLQLQEGVTGLFGPNGSGKSTLLRVLAGLLRPTSGSVTAFGRPLSMKNERLRGRIGYAGHRGGLYGRLTVMENLTMFARLHGAAAGRPTDVVEQLGLGERRNTLVGDLSAGYQRRAAMARALLHQPELLLLDEPYANLDEDASELVSRAVMEWRAPGRIAIIASHGAKKVKAYANAGLILQHGRVIKQGVYEAAGFRA